MNDPFRTTYRELSGVEKEKIERIKKLADQLHTELSHELIRNGAHIATLPSDARALALARTKLEECVMWATKAVTA